MTKTATKQIRCIRCGDPVEVPKWSGNKQECDKCKGAQPDAEIEALTAEHVEPAPIDKIKHAQEVLEVLGFTIVAGGAHYKQYQDGNAVVRISPFFEHGASFTEPECALEGFTVIRQEFIAVVDRDLAQRLPTVAHQDITTLLQELDIKLPGISLQQTNIDTIKCSKCGKDTAEWIQLVNSKELLCLERCAPVRYPHHA